MVSHILQNATSTLNMYQHFTTLIATYDRLLHFYDKLLIASFAEFSLAKMQKKLPQAIAAQYSICSIPRSREIAEPTSLALFSATTFWFS